MQKEKNQLTLFKLFLRCLKKWAIEIIALFIILATMYYELKNKDYPSPRRIWSTNADLIIVLLPLIITILSVVLSLSDRKTLGVNSNDFRKIRNSNTYSFLTMVLITIVIFVFYSVMYFFKLTISIYVLEAVSVFYAVWFVSQEIPILSNSLNVLKRTVGKAFKRNSKWTASDLKDNEVENFIERTSMDTSEKIVDTAKAKKKKSQRCLKKLEKAERMLKEQRIIILKCLQYITLTEGIEVAFNLIRTKRSKKASNNTDENIAAFNQLLILQYDYLLNMAEVVNDGNARKIIFNEEIELEQALEKSISNIREMVNLDSKINFVDIMGNNKGYYYITRSMFAIDKIFKQNSLNEKYKEKFSLILNDILNGVSKYEIELEKKNFLYKILNAMVVNSLSSESLWFVKLLRDGIYYEKYLVDASDSYFLFVSIYLYYLVNMEARVSKEFKKEIENFISEPATHFNQEGDTWKTILKAIIWQIDPQIIVKMLEIFKVEETYWWYIPKSSKATITNVADEFSESLLFRFWIEYLLTAPRVTTEYSSDIKLILEKLDENEKTLFSNEFSRWLNNTNTFNQDKELSILPFFGLENDFAPYYNDDAIAILMDLNNKIIMKKYKAETITSDFDKYQKLIKDKFNEAIESLPFHDDSLIVNKDRTIVMAKRFETKWIENSVTYYADGLKGAILNFIKECFVREIKPKEVDYPYTEEILDEILSFDAKYRFGNYFAYRQIKENPIGEKVNKIYKIETIKELYLPEDVFLKENAIKLKFEYSNESYVRKLTPAEIEKIIDQEYKQVDGIYEYKEYSDDRVGVLINRDDLADILSKRMFYVATLFNYEIKFEKENILFYKKVED